MGEGVQHNIVYTKHDSSEGILEDNPRRSLLREEAKS